MSMDEAPAAGVAVEPIGERFMLTGKIEQLEQIISIQGPWRDLMGVVGAQARYSLDPMPAGYQLLEADLPPDGSYPGRIHFGGSALAKKHQMVDRMALRFSHDEGGRVLVDGEGANRVGRYTIRGTCARSEECWDLELTRTYTPLARPLQRADSEGLTRKRSLDLGTVAEIEPRKPRAAAPPKGAWGAQPKSKDAPVEAKSQPSAMPKKPPKKDDGRPCIAVIFNGPDAFASVYRCPSIAVAKNKCAGLAPETQCAIRLGFDVGDGILLPPVDLPPAKLPQPANFPVPHDIIILDVKAPNAKVRAWKPSIYGFETPQRAANYAIHCYKTCGPRLGSLEWHAFTHDSEEAIPKLSLMGDGAFDTSLPIADYDALDNAARA